MWIISGADFIGTSRGLRRIQKTVAQQKCGAAGFDGVDHYRCGARFAHGYWLFFLS